MATMHVDTKVFHDPRMRRLARLLAWRERDTVGALLHVWAICYDRKRPVIEDPEDIDTAADHTGFAAAMIQVGLATPIEGGIQIRGSGKRLRHLETAIDNGRKGGELSAAKRRQESNPQTSTQATLWPEKQGLDRGGTSDVLLGAVAGGRRQPPPEAARLSRLLVDSITGNHPGNRLALAPQKARDEAVFRWGHTIRLMHERDGLTYAAIEDMIRWSQVHEFWRGTILGGDALRENWDTMAGQRNRVRGGQGNERQRGPTAQGLDRVRQLEREEQAEEERRAGGGSR